MIHSPIGADRGKRRRARVLLLIFPAVLAVLVVAGCATEGRGEIGEESTATDTLGSTPRENTEREETSPVADVDGRTGHPKIKGDTEPFVLAAEDSGGVAGAANRIEGVRFKVLDGYERVLIDFGRGGEEAPGVPDWSLEKPPEGGYVRLRFPGVTSTKIGGESLVGNIMDALYVVRDRDDGMFVDVFSMDAFRYRVTELPETGQLALDFREVRGGLDLPPMQTSEKVVVLQPRVSEEVNSPLTVRGYSRLFEARTTVTLVGREGEVLASETVLADDWTSAWGRYEATLEFSGYEGLATLRVGGESPRDGTFVGAEMEIIIEESTDEGDR